MSMIDLVLAKRELLQYVQDVRVRLEGTCIKRIEVVNGNRRIKSEKLKEHQYKGRHVRVLRVRE